MAEPTRAEPALFALPRDTLVVRGADRKTWLDGLLTCAVTGVGEGVGGYGLLLSKPGKIVTDAWLLDDGRQLWVGVALGRGELIRETLDRYLVMEDAELELLAEPFRWLIALPSAGAETATAVAEGALTLGSLQARLLVTRHTEAVLPAAAELLAEHGLGVFGVDFNERDNPHEASLDRIAVSWTKGCYLGQEVVCMQDMRGKVKRRLVALDSELAQIESETSPLEVLNADGSVAGQVSSVHRTAGGTRLFASISTSALESHGELRIRGEPVRVAFGATSNLS